MESSYEELATEECLAMFISKRCSGRIMECQNNHCVYNKPPIEEYAWLQEKISIEHHYETNWKMIYGTSIDQPIFDEAQSKCTASELFCKLDRVTIIWEKDVIHSVPSSKSKKPNSP